jgi:hypothetical protein
MRQFGRSAQADFFPRYGLCFPGIEVGNAAGDFFIPRSFDNCGILARPIEAFKERVPQLRPLFGRERKLCCAKIPSYFEA